MPTLKAIRGRIASVKNTQKITRAMKLVAAARLRRAQQRILELRPYANKVTEVLASVTGSMAGDAPAPGSTDEETIHPLLATRPEGTRAMIVTLTSDRGLAGAFNANIQRAGDRRMRELTESGKSEVQLATIGRKGRDYFKRRGVTVTHDLTGAYEGGAKRSAEIARMLVDEFVSGRVDVIEVIYTEFKSAITQTVRVEQLLPIVPGGAGIVASGGAATDATDVDTGPVKKPEFIYEPDRKALLERLLPMYVETMLFRAMLESVASEHGSRMTAMDNATTNASDMIGALTLQYNRARQAAITKELMEIIGGAEALKG